MTDFENTLTPHGATQWARNPVFGIIADDYHYYGDVINYRGHCSTGYYSHFFETQAELDNFLSPRTFRENIPPYREDNGNLPWIENEEIKVGYERIYNDTRYKAIQEHRSQFTPDLTPALWETVPTSDDWIEGAYYRLGRVIKYNEKWWEVIQAHTSQANWQPPNVPALFEEIQLPTLQPTTPNWELPAESNPYQKYEVVQWNGRGYMNYVDENHWHPEVYGWIDVGEIPAQEVIDPWVQPVGAQDAYQTGDKVSHNGQNWISTVDNNVWEPGVFGWEVWNG